jgi:hypothetical protein
MNYESSYKINSKASITDLLNRTCDNQPKYKKFAEKLLASNNIFQPDISPYRRKKQTVYQNQYTENKSYAGMKNIVTDEVKFFNVNNYK